MKSITLKIILLTIAVALVVGLTVGLLNSYIIYKASESDLANLENSMNQSYDRLIRSEVQTAVSLLNAIQKKIEKGEIKDAEGKKLAADLIRELRYESEGYFWADTKEGINVVLLGRDSEGKSRINLQDTKGKFLIQEIINNGLKPDGGYTDYWFSKKEGGESLPKRGYSLYHKSFDWIIGTGNYIDDINKIINDEKEKKRKEIKERMFFMFGILIFTILLASVAAVFIGRHISNPLKNLTNEVEKIAQGDLTVEIQIKQKDEVGRLSKSISIMIGKLREIISSIHHSSENFVQVSREVNTTAENISLHVNISASSTEELSASMEQMASNVNQNLDNANETEIIATKAVSQVEQVYDSFKKTVEALNTIAKKINIVNTIAEKTDLLAVNAAIEAARAGLQGKGFAVVATEVRKLAEISLKSASEIEQLTSSIVKYADKSLLMLEEVIPGIKKNASLVEGIKIANLEFNSGIEQINNAISQLVHTAQANASISEELSSSSSELESQAKEMNHMVSFFKLEQNDGKNSEEQNKIMFDAFMQMYANYLKSNPLGDITTFTKQVQKNEQEPPVNKGIDINLKDETDKLFEKF